MESCVAVLFSFSVLWVLSHFKSLFRLLMVDDCLLFEFMVLEGRKIIAVDMVPVLGCGITGF